MKRILLLLILLLAGFGDFDSRNTARAQSADALFQQALTLERAQGDLKGAIALYERIVREYPGSRTVAARSLLQLGKAYERAGRDDARAAYERLVREYSDQGELVAEARERIGGLVGETAAASRTRLMKLAPELSTYGAWGGAFSPDGKYFVNTDWAAVRSGFQEVGKREVTYFTPEQSGTVREPAGEGFVFAPDGRSFAYIVQDSLSAMWIYDMTNHSSRIVSPTPDADFGAPWPLDWSSDGRSILALIHFPFMRSQLALIDVASGKPLRRADVESVRVSVACLLDDRYVLFQQDGLLESTVRVLDFDSGETRDFVPNGANSQLLGCSGKLAKGIVRSDLFGNGRVWMYAVRAGQPLGDPTALLDVETDVVRLFIRDSGDLMYFRGYNLKNTSQIFPFSAADGTVTGRGETLPKARAQWAGPGWTKDGSRLAYRVDWTKMWVRDQDGSSAVVPLARWVTNYKWSPDGTVFVGSVTGDPAKTFRLDSSTGAVVDSTVGFYGFPGLSGSSLLAIDRKDPSTMCVYEVPSGSTTPREFLCYADEKPVPEYAYVYVSPDSRKLLLAFRNNTFKVVNLETRTVASLPYDAEALATIRPWQIAWLPDGSGLLAKRNSQVVRLALDGGDPVPQLVQFGEVNSIGWFSLHPSGDRILINSIEKSPIDDDEPKDLHVISRAIEPGRD